jgi:hypothetical protein
MNCRKFMGVFILIIHFILIKKLHSIQLISYTTFIDSEAVRSSPGQLVFNKTEDAIFLTRII